MFSCAIKCTYNTACLCYKMKRTLPSCKYSSFNAGVVIWLQMPSFSQSNVIRRFHVEKLKGMLAFKPTGPYEVCFPLSYTHVTYFKCHDDGAWSSTTTTCSCHAQLLPIRDQSRSIWVMYFTCAKGVGHTAICLKSFHFASCHVPCFFGVKFT